jgi:hypothetical protein
VRAYIDYDGVIYFCGEYYMPGREVWQHAPALRDMEGIRNISVAYADPTIFDATMQQSNQPTQPGKAAERAKSINDLYIEQGIELFSPFNEDRSDISFAARLNTHWSNLDEREPTVKIVCRNYAEKPQPGLHNWDCPNLLCDIRTYFIASRAWLSLSTMASLRLRVRACWAVSFTLLVRINSHILSLPRKPSASEPWKSQNPWPNKATFPAPISATCK